MHLRNFSELRKQPGLLKSPPKQRPAACTASPWKVQDALALSRPYCSSPSPTQCSDRLDRQEKEGAKEEREVINTVRESLGCLPSCGQEAMELRGRESRIRAHMGGASGILIPVAIFPATRRQCGTSFGGSNPSSFTYHSTWANGFTSLCFCLPSGWG